MTEEKLLNDNQGKNIEIYMSDIELIESEYIESLPDESLIYKSNCFNGLLLKIYQTVLVNILPKGYRNDYILLNDIFYKVYLPLCFRYNISPTIIQFCSVLTGIDNTNISDIKNGVFRNGYPVKDVNATQIVKSWYAVCESGLLSRAVNDNSIGAIFSLKSLYAYTEAPAALPDVKQDPDIVDISFLTDQGDMAELPKYDDD